LTISTLLDIFHTTPQSSQRLIPIAFENQCVASVAALRETKMSSSVDNQLLTTVQTISNKLKQFPTTT
jgi:tryptophanyl-tRNA synthetase